MLGQLCADMEDMDLFTVIAPEHFFLIMRHFVIPDRLYCKHLLDNVLTLKDADGVLASLSCALNLHVS